MEIIKKNEDQFELIFDNGVKLSNGFITVNKASFAMPMLQLPGRPPAMLTQQVAKIYGTKTKILNRQIRKHHDRFPDDFLFICTDQEKKMVNDTVLSMSQVLSLPKNCKLNTCDQDSTSIVRNVLHDIEQNLSKTKHSEHNYLFLTRFGINQASSVVRTEEAAKRSVVIMRYFSAMEEKILKEMTRQNKTSEEKIKAFEHKIHEKELENKILQRREFTDAVSLNYFCRILETNHGIRLTRPHLDTILEKLGFLHKSSWRNPSPYFTNKAARTHYFTSIAPAAGWSDVIGLTVLGQACMPEIIHKYLTDVMGLNPETDDHTFVLPAEAYPSDFKHNLTLKINIRR
jgi:transposase